jgi:homoserine O-acetyltransferase/O-succinyltransferase
MGRGILPQGIALASLPAPQVLDGLKPSPRTVTMCLNSAPQLQAATPDWHPALATVTPLLEPAEEARPLPGAGLRSIAVELPLRHAGRRRLRLECEWQGPRDAPAIWVAGGISANRHVAASALDGSAGWWENTVGAGRGLDPTRYRLIGCDWIGADGRLDAPIDTQDQADAVAAVLDALGIDQLHAFVGASYGAMVGLAFAGRHPTRLQRLVALAGAHRPHPYAAAFRALQRQVVALGQLQCDGQQGLALARQLAMLSYRTPDEFAERFADPVVLDGGRARGPAEDYLASCGARYVSRWTPTAFLRLSESIDLHCIDPATVRVPTTLLAVEQDWLVPPAEVEQLAAAIRAPVELQRIESRFGHDAFLKETALVNALLQRAIDAQPLAAEPTCPPATTEQESR